MSKSDTLETAILASILQAQSYSGLFQNVSTGALTVTWTSLHTSDPGDTGGQATNESTYAGYARVSVARSTAGWSVASGSASPSSAISFPQATSTSTSIVTHFAIGRASATTGEIFFSGTVTPNINIGMGVTPILTTASAIVET
jgi:hypothetical protein